ncbi:hypothetical protein SIM91_44055 [Rhodococcus opacus]|uniref:hypothetical protein n=1 Tax=Rhodococcus opacus TaxID=37919 RepID=UPI0007CD46B8|nr:hypothetical protein [Rhodococcus opacus]MDX5970120.1 hypothetical protein [Rhodococcus opacus]NKY75208.1 hypothetical protein [Rhodococcus opacus]CAG7633547.1 hypothetical protein E143388_07512 [Rhodococcus opacus]
MRLDSVPVALARLNYRLLRIPLQVIEDRGMSRIDERAPARLAFEHFLIDCDRAAAHLLGDENAAARAADLRRHTTTVRFTIAHQQERIYRERLMALAQQRARFNERRRRGGAPRS